MKFNCLPGECLLLPKKINSTEHLWIVLTTPEGEAGEVAFVNLTSWESGYDKTVVLKKGDHSFIDHDTVVNYMDARIVKADALLNAADSGYFDVLEPLRPEVLKKIQEGVFRSSFTPRKVKEFCKGKFPS